MSKRTSPSISQLLVLNTAAQRSDHMILPLPRALKAKGAAQQKLLQSLITAGLIEEIPIEIDVLCWRQNPGGARFGLRLTPLGLTTVNGKQVQSSADRPTTAASSETPASAAVALDEGNSGTESEPEPGQTPGVMNSSPRNGLQAEPTPQGSADNLVAPPGATRTAKTSKKALIENLVRRPEGAMLTELMTATGWQEHSVRAALTGLRKEGKPLGRSRDESGASRYRLSAAA